MRAWAISRATMSVPRRFRRVLIGYFVRISRTLSIPSSRSMSTAGDMAGACFGRNRAGFFSNCSRKMPSGGDLRLDVAVGRAAHADGHGARSGMARRTDHPHVMHEVLAAELSAHAALLTDFFEHLLLPFQIAEAAAALVARRGQRVEITCRGLLHGREAHFGRRSADADRQMVGRAGRSAQILDVGTDELGERLLVEQRLGLLVEEGLVGRTAALGDEEELVLHAGVASVDVDLRRKVRARILLVGHREGNHLRIAQVALL